MSENSSFLDRLIAWMGSVRSLVVHTIVFVASFTAIGFGVDADKVFLVLTTAVSLEAIYLSLLIQMSVNKASASIEGISDDIEEIQEDIEDIQEDVEEISDDLEELSDDIEEISDDIEEIQEDLEEEETTIDATHIDTLHQILTELAAIREEMRELKRK